MLKYFFQIYFPLILFYPYFICGQSGFKKFYRAPNSTLNHAKDVVETPAGNLIVTGLTADSTYGQRLSLLGLDASGTELWRKNYGNPNFLYLDYSELSRAPMLKDASGFYQPITVWDTLNDYYSVLLRFDFNGDTLWQKKFISSIPNEFFYIHSVCHTMDGGLILSGIVADMNNGTENALIIKTDLNGNVIWQKNLLSPITNPVAVWRINRSVQDSSTKKIISVGWRYDSNWQATALLLIADSIGNPIYSASLSGMYGGYFRDLTQTNDGNFVAVGEDYTNINCGNTVAAWLYIVKFNINGSVIWSKKYSSPSCYNSIWTINETNNGDLILGSVMDTLSYSLSNPNLNIYNHIIKTDNSGNIIWTKDFDFTNHNYNDQIRSVHLGSNGSIFTVVELPMSLNSPYILIKMDSTGCDSTPVYCADPVLVDEFYNKTGFNFEMYPNPTNGTFNLLYSFTEELDLTYSIRDVLGREVSSGPLSANEIREIDLSSIKKGLYFVSLTNADRLIESTKLILTE